MTLFGVDTSNNNWSSVAECEADLEALVQQGYSWVAAKCTQGSGFKDGYWAATKDACAKAGLPLIGYHYVDTSDPNAQAQNFIANGGGKFVEMDYEDGGGDIANFWRVVVAFTNAGVRTALSYIPKWYWENIGSPDLTPVVGLVSSGYPISGEDFGSTLYNEGGGDNGEGWDGYGGASPIMWQFTDRANAGLALDGMAFKGDAAALLNVLTLGTASPPVVAPTPAPTPAPAPDPVPVVVGPFADQLTMRFEMLGGQTLVEAVAQIRDSQCGTNDRGKTGVVMSDGTNATLTKKGLVAGEFVAPLTPPPMDWSGQGHMEADNDGRC